MSRLGTKHLSCLVNCFLFIFDRLLAGLPYFLCMKDNLIFSYLCIWFFNAKNSKFIGSFPTPFLCVCLSVFPMQWKHLWLSDIFLHVLNLWTVCQYKYHKTPSVFSSDAPFLAFLSHLSYWVIDCVGSVLPFICYRTRSTIQ